MSRPAAHSTSVPDCQPGAPVPFIVLTGFLGAGKTTLLNRLLAAEHHRKVAVLVNELGQIDIDAGLIRARSSDVMELSGGCVCHQLGVQRELWSALDEVVLRSRPDAIVLETSGIAEPDEIVRGLVAWREEERGRPKAEAVAVADRTRDEDEDDGGIRGGEVVDGRGLSRLTLPAVVTVVDAQAGAEQMARHAEARAQVRSADQIVLAKTELSSADTLARLHGVLVALNADAERVAFPQGREADAALPAWLVDLATAAVAGEVGARAREARRDNGGRTIRSGSGHAAAHAHRRGQGHGHQLAAASYIDEVPLVAEALLLACCGLGARLVRAKGFVHVAGETRRGFLEVAGLETSLRLGEAWGPEEKRVTRLVLIGEGLDDEIVRRRLWACRAQGLAKD
jgi:G3E family GTPase